MTKGRKGSHPKVSIPRPNKSGDSSSSSPTSTGLKTPADEGIEFFQSPSNPGEAAIRVYELRLDIDGGPHKDRSVRFVVILSIPYNF